MSPSFDTYALTALDHLIPPVYLGGLLTLDLQGKNRKDALDRLEVAANRLASHLPFLGGYVVPAPPVDGKVNAFQVQDNEYHGDAFFVLQEHSTLTPLLLNGRLNPDFTPSAPVFQPQDPCPVLRIKANIVADALYLVYHFHHMAMDGVGGSVMSRTLAQLCCDPDTPLHELPTSSDAQKRMQAHLLKLGSSSTPHPLRWQPKPFEFSDLDLTDPRNTTLNRRFRIRAEKLQIIQDACRMRLQGALSASQFQDTYLSPSLILAAVFGLCTHRARQAAGLEVDGTANVIIAINLRKQLGLSASYMGNSLVTIECPLDTKIVPAGTTIPGRLLSGLPLDDARSLCNFVLVALQELQSYNKNHAAGMLATLGALTDRSSVGLASSGLWFSDTHKMDFYQDFGPLGEVQDFAIPGNEFAGLCWMLATKSPGYDLQIALERAAMGELERDPLFQWVTDPGSSKSKL